jgi:tetratricopeptide (TPR) repeat protein
MIMSGMLRCLGKRFFSFLNKVQEAESQHGMYSKESLEAHMAYAWNLLSLKKHEEALNHHKKALEISSKVLGNTSAEYSKVLQKIAHSYESVGNLQTSLTYYLQAYKIDIQYLPSAHEDLLYAANRIGAMYADTGDLKSADEYLNKILSPIQASDNQELKAAFFGNFGHVKMRLGDKDKSLEYFLIATDMQKKFGYKQDIMIKYLQSLGMCYWVNSQYSLAKSSFEEALALLEVNFNHNTLQIVDIYGHLAYLHNDMKQEKTMHEYFDKAYQVFFNSTLPDKNQKIFDFLKNISETMKSVGNIPNTQTYLQKLLDFCKKYFGENSRYTADTYQQFSLLNLNLNNIQESLNYCEKALNSRKSLENNHYDLLYSYNQYAAIYHTIGNLDLASKYLASSSKILENHPSKALEISHYYNLALLYRDQKNINEAEKYMLKHIDGVLQEYGEKHPATAAAYSGLGHIYRVGRDYSKGLEAYKKALSINEAALGRENLSTADCLEYIGEIHRLKGDFQEALKLHNEDLTIKTNLLGDSHFSVHIPYYNLANTYLDMKDIENSLLYARKRLDLFYKLYKNNHEYVAVSYTFIARIFLHARQKSQALEALNKARDILVALNNQNAIADVDKKIAEIQKSP